MSHGRTFTLGAGLGLGAMFVAPAAAQAEDFQVTNLNDDGPGSLRQALEEASDDSTTADRVLFKSKLSGRITLQNDSLYVSGPTEILGPGARKVSLTTDGNFGVLFINTNVGDDVLISDLTFTGVDTDADGAGIDKDFADLTLERTVISGNTSTDDGAGIDDYQGSLTIDSSTISGNEAGDYGGGIRTYSSPVTLTNSTISGNSAAGAAGIGGGFDPVDIEVRNSTIVRNSATYPGGGVYASNASVTLHGAIVADNSAGSGGDDLENAGGSTFDGSFNLIEDPGNAMLPAANNLLGIDPKLKPLKNNGGPTDTHAFKKSPVKNKIPKGETPKSDQRGAKRKGKGDIGAYELVKCEGVVVNVVGTTKKDKLKGTKKADGILGLGGNDKLSGKKGKDGLCGGKGKDKLKGGPGKDKLDGGPGKDKEVQ